MKQTTGNNNNNFLVSCGYSIKDTIFAKCNLTHMFGVIEEMNSMTKEKNEKK